MKAQVRVVPAFGPWGEAGDVWAHGVATRDEHGRLELYRTGPFIPPLTVPEPGTLVITDAARQAIEAVLPGSTFREVILANVVAVESFDALAGDDPEDLLFDGPHAPSAAAALGKVWEFVTGDDGAFDAAVADALRAVADEWVTFTTP